MGSLNGKVAIVTGGARGIGAATVRRFAKEGAKVVIADMLDKEGEALATEIGCDALYLHHDVSEEASWRNLVTATTQRFGGNDVLVNVAGILTVSTIVNFDAAAFERVLRVNLFGTFLGIKYVAPLMIKKGKGSIINISSTEGLRGTNGMGAYASSKWGVRGLTKVAAMELGPQGVRVNSVHPGPVNTPMTNPTGLPAVEMDKAFKHQPIQRMAMPEELASVCLFLAGDEASYVCGAELAADGGMTAGQYMEFMPGMPSVI